MKTVRPWLAKTSLFLICGISLLIGASTLQAARDHDKIGVATSLIAAAVPAAVVVPKKLKVNAGMEDDFLANIAALRDSVNAMLAGLPPLEQFEASAELSYGLRSLTSYANNLIECMENMGQRVEAYAAKMKADAAATAEAELLSKGTHILKSDAETAQNAALDQQKTTLETSFTAERQKETVVKTRRAELAADAEILKTIPAVAIAHLNAEALAAEDYKAKLPAFAERLKKIAAAGVRCEVESDFMAEMMSLPLDEASDKTVTARCESVSKLIKACASRPSGNGVRAEMTPFPVGGGGAAKPLRTF